MHCYLHVARSFQNAKLALNEFIKNNSHVITEYSPSEMRVVIGDIIHLFNYAANKNDSYKFLGLELKDAYFIDDIDYDVKQIVRSRIRL